MAEEAARISKEHQKWMLETLKENGGSCTYEVIVRVGEEKHCDTVGAMLRVLKMKKAISYDGMFLMYPGDKAQVVKLVNPDYDPFAQ